jgi:hypothetical protein
MRRSIFVFLMCFCPGLGLVAASPVVAGPIRLGVEPITPIEGPVLVRVSGHYISIHNGRSHHWKDDFVPAGGRHFIPLGPVNPIINVGVSVRIVHPEIVSDSARSKSTPLLLRPVGFETFEPRTWRDILAKGEARFGDRPETPAGHVVAQANWHLRSILDEYLPALDGEGGSGESDAALPDQIALLEEIARYALDTPPPTPGNPRSVSPENLESYQRSILEHDLKYRMEIEEGMHRLREWLSLDRDQRRRMHSMLAQIRYAKRVANQLMTEADRQRLGAFIGEVTRKRPRGETAPKHTSWVDPTTQVAYRVHVQSPSGDCVRLSIRADLTGVVSADLGEMSNSVKGRFCRASNGKSRLAGS